MPCPIKSCAAATAPVRWSHLRRHHARGISGAARRRRAGGPAGGQAPSPCAADRRGRRRGGGGARHAPGRLRGGSASGGVRWGEVARPGRPDRSLGATRAGVETVSDAPRRRGSRRQTRNGRFAGREFLHLGRTREAGVPRAPRTNKNGATRAPFEGHPARGQDAAARRRRTTAPRMPRPAANIAYVSGSGTAKT